MDVKEQEVVVRSVTRICRGPALFPKEVSSGLLAGWDALRGIGSWEQCIQLKEQLETKINAAHVAVAPDDWDNLDRRVHELCVPHTSTLGKWCGTDFNDTIMSNPLDGKVYTYTCPNCKTTGSYRAPIFD